MHAHGHRRLVAGRPPGRRIGRAGHALHPVVCQLPPGRLVGRLAVPLLHPPRRPRPTARPVPVVRRDDEVGRGPRYRRRRRDDGPDVPGRAVGGDPVLPPGDDREVDRRRFGQGCPGRHAIVGRPPARRGRPPRVRGRRPGRLLYRSRPVRLLPGRHRRPRPADRDGSTDRDVPCRPAADDRPDAVGRRAGGRGRRGRGRARRAAVPGRPAVVPGGPAGRPRPRRVHALPLHPRSRPADASRRPAVVF